MKFSNLSFGGGVTVNIWRDGQWQSVGGGASGLSPKPPSGPSLNVASGCATLNTSRATTGVSYLSATKHRLAVDVDGITMSWVALKDSEATVVGSTYRFAVGTPRTPAIEVKFNGAAGVTITPTTDASAVTVTSDVVPIKALAGDDLTVYAWVEERSGGNVATDISGYLPSVDLGTGAGVYSNAMANVTHSASRAASMRPSRIVAPSNKSSWILGGDSITWMPTGFLEKAARIRGFPFVKTARGGEKHGAGIWDYRYAPHTAFATGLIDQLGINGWTDQLAVDHWLRAKTAGIQNIIKTTLTLDSSTTDNWTTLENQSWARAGRVPANQWLRDGAPIKNGVAQPVGTVDAIRCSVVNANGTITVRNQGHPLTAVSDVVAAVESSQDSGKYSLAAGTLLRSTNHLDGLHPNEPIMEVLGDRLARDLGLLGF